MILNTKEFKDVAKTVLYAIDSKSDGKQSVLFTETLELKAEGTNLDLNITNREYYVTAKFKLASPENLTAAVNAKVFLNLISKITSDKIEITKDGNSIKIKANGEYKLPMIFNNDTLLELPKIEIGNVTNSMVINSSILRSIAVNNSKELVRGTIVRPVQNYYYIDELGAITFTSGACDNRFTLEKPVKLLLDDKVVKLFKLFKDDSNVTFTLGQDALTEDIIQSKVSFATSDVIITALLKDTSLISTVPATAIRNMADKVYTYSVVLEKTSLLQAIQRLLLLNSDENGYGYLDFSNNKLIIFDYSRINKEELSLVNECEALSNYSMLIDLNYLQSILDGVDDEYVTINFGDQKAAVIKKVGVSDIIPELRAK